MAPTVAELDSVVRAFYEGRGEQVCLLGLVLFVSCAASLDLSVANVCLVFPRL